MLESARATCLTTAALCSPSGDAANIGMTTFRIPGHHELRMVILNLGFSHILLTEPSKSMRSDAALKSLPTPPSSLTCVVKYWCPTLPSLLTEYPL